MILGQPIQVNTDLFLVFRKPVATAKSHLTVAVCLTYDDTQKKLSIGKTIQLVSSDLREP